MWVLVKGIVWLIGAIIRATWRLIIPESLVWGMVNISTVGTTIYFLFISSVFFSVSSYFLVLFLSLSLLDSIKDKHSSSQLSPCLYATSSDSNKKIGDSKEKNDVKFVQGDKEENLAQRDDNNKEDNLKYIHDKIDPQKKEKEKWKWSWRGTRTRS